MRIMETQVFRFSELSDEAKEKAIESCRLFNVEDTEWYDCTLDEWKEKLDLIGFTKPDIYFSGFSSQGDGACFECKYIDIEKAFNAFIAENPVTHKNWLLDYIDSYCSVSLITINHRYSHENTRQINYNIRFDDYPHINKIAEAFFVWLESKRYDLCREIYRELEKQYDYLTSDESIIETIEANEYEFTSEGEMV